MKHTTLLLAALCISFNAAAQSVSYSYESVRLSELFMDATWSAQEKLLPALIAAEEASLRQRGFSERVSTVFARELQKTLSREHVGKAMAAFLSQALSTDETRDLDAFLRSSLGRKFLALNRDMGSSPAYIAQLLKPACESAIRELSGEDRKAMEHACSR